MMPVRMYIISLTYERKSRTIFVFLRCGYGLDLPMAHGTLVFQLRCTLNRTVGNICSTDNRTAPYDSWKI